MTLSRRILSRPLTMIIMFVVLSVAGFTLIDRLAIDLMPEVEMPAMVVVTTYPMASPSEVEDTITRTVEEQLANVSGLDSLTSYSYDGYSMVILMLDFDTDISDATADVRDKLSQVSSLLPDEAQDPLIFHFDPNAQAVITLALTGEQGLEELLLLAEKEVQPRLERIKGAAEVSLSGGLEEIVLVEFYRERLDSLGLNISQISSALASQNMKLGAGEMVEGGTNYLIQTSGEIRTLDDLSRTIITTRPLGSSGKYEVLLRDVADVRFDTREQESLVLINGREGIQISIKKTDEANMVELVSRIKEEVKDLESRLPVGTAITVMQDNSLQVESVLSEVIKSALLGTLFAVLVLLLFLRRVKSTFIIAISIPVSLLITIGGMSLGGKTFNMISLTGLILALGMIVDGSIVVIENIFRYRQKGALQQSSAELGTQEVIGAITGSILTSVSVFLPLLIFRNDLGVIGIMFEDMAFTVVVALLASLAVSILLVPVLASRVFPIHTREEKPLRNRFLRGLDGRMDASMERFTLGYRKVVGWALKHRLVVVGLSLILLLLSVFQIPRLGIIMVPPTGETSIILDVVLPEGTALETTEEVMLQWQSFAMEQVPEEDRRSIVVTAGSGGGLGSGGGSHVGKMEISLPPSSQRSLGDEEIRSALRSRFTLFPDARISFSTTDQARMMTGSADVSLRFQGQDLDALVEVTDEFLNMVRTEIPEVLEFTSSQSNALPELKLMLDRQRVYDLGLSTQMIAYELRSQIAGVTSTTFAREGEILDVVLQLREEDRDSTFDINNLFVTSQTGRKIPFSSFGEVVKSTGPVSIYRENRAKTITLSGSVAPGAVASFVQKEVEDLAARNLILPDGVSIATGGQFEMLEDSMDAMVLVLIFAGLLVFAVMVSQFESLKSPFIIFAMIPMLLIGVVLVYTIIGEPLSMPSLIGIVMLLGIVVNNGIILVDSINLHRKRGLTVVRACLDAASNRLRPVLMTTLTTILAMLPMALSGGSDTAMVKPIGLTVIGGLTSNTVITLFLVPVLYMMLHRKERKKEELAMKEEVVV
jgi:hydrophobic/amphiphilic exporter-1 (mainly G- bacteria), HAE1 family